jgi:tRNA U34 5-carboxymethylaminomethyl modifying GTPase MnmE/TrmE
MREIENKEEGRKQRDHTKTGKLAKKRELKRLEAIERSVRRVQEFEKSVETGPTSSLAKADLNHAQYVLQTIRGGTDQHKLAQQFGVKLASEPKPAE